METENKQIVKLLFRISKNKRTEKDIPYSCRLCFKPIKKGQIFNLIEEGYMDCREYYVHSSCLNFCLNKKVILAKHKIYYKKNRDKILKQKREYYEKLH